MMSLSSLAHISGTKAYWVDGLGATISGAQLGEFLNRNSALISNSTKKSVAIFQRNRALTAQLLYFLDGICSRLFVVPPDLQLGQLSKLLSQLDIEILVTDTETEELNSKVDVLRVKLVDEPNGNELTLNSHDTGAIDTEWIIATSGTTGEPKLVVHTLSELSGSLKKDPSKGCDFVWGLLYDLSKYAGLQVYLQSLLGGSTLLVPNDMTPLDKQVLYFIHNKCNAMSATPTLWRKILMLPTSQKLQLKQITLGGEIADQPILDALALQFPRAKITHIYASTEAGVGFSVSDCHAGFPAEYLVESPRGVLLKVVDNRLFLKSDNLAKSIIDVSTYKDSDGYIDTGDLVELKGNRYYFLGRASGLINVGGNKVYPEEVEQVLLSHERIKLARVYAKKSHLMGDLVVCDMVVDIIDTDLVAQLKKQIRAHCSQYLPDWKTPVLFNIVDNIDNANSGKQVRK